MHFFKESRLFPILCFSVGVLCSSLLATSLSKKFLKHKEFLIEIELERKILFLKKAIESEKAKAHDCLFEATSAQDTCTHTFILHEGLWLYDMRIFRNDTLMFEKNINPEIPWNSWIKRQELEAKNYAFTFEMKPTAEHLEFLESDFPLIIFVLGGVITSAFAALTWSFQVLFQKKEKLKKVRDDFFSINITLRKKNSELEEYAHVVAHDLQEPLNTIIGFIEVIKEDHQVIFENKKIEHYITFISDSSRRMSKTIKELLLYAKLGKNSKPEFVDIGQTIKETLIDLTHLIKRSNATINLPENLPTVKGHSLEIKLLFQNLLINAIKYQKTNTKPVISLFFKESYFENRFTIQDNGIGIDEKYQETIFKLFHRLHNLKEYSGSGIGLAKCKKIIDLHNGIIWVDSVPGQGSKFHFIIPKS